MSGCVYLIQVGRSGPYKIGYTSGRPEKRLAQLQTSHYERLSLVAVVPGGATVERHLHRAFASVRLAGEWFEPIPAIVDTFADVQWPAHLETLPPVTKAGREVLKAAIKSGDVREYYPDGCEHSRLDWDQVAADVALYEQFAR